MLSKKAKYALNALVHLAKRPKQEPVLISEIAQKEHIPKKFLEAILLDLRRAGILNSKKGKGGGYYLFKNAEDINMADVVRLFDGAIALLPCTSFKYYERCDECIDEETCGIRNLFQEIHRETVEKLKHSTLADIVRREADLKAQQNKEA
jgi:Rrf2 family protein